MIDPNTISKICVKIPSINLCEIVTKSGTVEHKFLNSEQIAYLQYCLNCLTEDYKKYLKNIIRRVNNDKFTLLSDPPCYRAYIECMDGSKTVRFVSNFDAILNEMKLYDNVEVIHSDGKLFTYVLSFVNKTCEILPGIREIEDIEKIIPAPKKKILDVKLIKILESCPPIYVVELVSDIGVEKRNLSQSEYEMYMNKLNKKAKVYKICNIEKLADDSYTVNIKTYEYDDEQTLTCDKVKLIDLINKLELKN